MILEGIVGISIWSCALIPMHYWYVGYSYWRCHIVGFSIPPKDFILSHVAWGPGGPEGGHSEIIV